MFDGVLKKYKTFLNENSIKLIRKSKYYDAEVRLVRKNIEISNMNTDFLKGSIENFFSVMATHCKYFSTSYFINNFKTLKFKELSPKEIIELEKEGRLKSCSRYEGEKNLITLNKVEYDHIFHELIHFSSRKKDNVFNEGFYYYIEGAGYVGRGINEGYTEIIRERYFNLDLKTIGYLYEYQMTKHLELILGQEFMERAFFQGSILEVIRELSKYCSLEEAKKFIDNMDLMVSYIDKEDEKSKQIRKYLLDKNYLFLKQCIATKNQINKVK